MKIFLDTADLEEIEKYKHLIDGVTTNPTLMNKAGLKYNKRNIKKLCNLVKGRPVSVEAISTDLDHFIEEAVILDEYASNIVIKVPMTDYGLESMEELHKWGIKTNVTLVFSPTQALLAAKAGADYVSVFVGRLDDVGQRGMDVVRDTLQIFKNYKFKAEVIVASIRNMDHVVESAKLGAHVATIPPSVLEEAIKHELTDKGVKKFLEDYAKLNK